VDFQEVLVSQKRGTMYFLTSPSRKNLDKGELLSLLGDIANEPQEHFVVMTFDGGGRLINKHLVYIGTVDSIAVYVRDVFAKAMPDFPSAIIVSHNHPGSEDDLHPSKADIRTTNQIIAAGQILGVPLLDHIIVSGDEHYSFVANGLIFPALI
jgi:DNA repair protein RadC